MNPGDFSSQPCRRLLLLFPISSSAVRLERVFKRSKHACTREEYAGPTHRSSQVGEHGLQSEPHQTNNTHINVNSTNSLILFLMSN